MVVRHHTVTVDGLDLFFREAGDPSAPTMLLLHDIPATSSTFKQLIARLGDRFHLIAPDLPGFGYSGAPSVAEWKYTFDNLAQVVNSLLEAKGIFRYGVYLHGCGAAVGFRLAMANPDRIAGIVTQNANAYSVGLTSFWDPMFEFWEDPNNVNADNMRAVSSRMALEWRYSHGGGDPVLIDPDLVALDHAWLSRPGNDEIQLALIYDYRDNVAQYAQWQDYLRTHQPPVLAVWGRHDEIFDPAGATAFRQDVPAAQVVLLEAGHCALHTRGEQIADLVRQFATGISA